MGRFIGTRLVLAVLFSFIFMFDPKAVNPVEKVTTESNAEER